MSTHKYGHIKFSHYIHIQVTDSQTMLYYAKRTTAILQVNISENLEDEKNTKVSYSQLFLSFICLFIYLFVFVLKPRIVKL